MRPPTAASHSAAAHLIEVLGNAAWRAARGCHVTMLRAGEPAYVPIPGMTQLISDRPAAGLVVVTLGDGVGNLAWERVRVPAQGALWPRRPLGPWLNPRVSCWVSVAAPLSARTDPDDRRATPVRASGP